jgi:hypothetical protein
MANLGKFESLPCPSTEAHKGSLDSYVLIDGKTEPFTIVKMLLYDIFCNNVIIGGLLSLIFSSICHVYHPFPLWYPLSQRYHKGGIFFAGTHRRRDPKASKFLEIFIKEGEGNLRDGLQAQDSSIGSFGYHSFKKAASPESREHYQCDLSFTLIGSKPGK